MHNECGVNSLHAMLPYRLRHLEIIELRVPVYRACRASILGIVTMVSDRFGKMS